MSGTQYAKFYTTESYPQTWRYISMKLTNAKSKLEIKSKKLTLNANQSRFFLWIYLGRDSKFLSIIIIGLFINRKGHKEPKL